MDRGDVCYLRLLCRNVEMLFVAVRLQFLVVETQLIFGGRSHALDPEEYISGAVALYVDMCFMFLIILGFMPGSSN